MSGAELENAAMGAAFRVGQLTAALESISTLRCHCNGYGGPCGCGHRAREMADDALNDFCGIRWDQPNEFRHKTCRSIYPGPAVTP